MHISLFYKKLSIILLCLSLCVLFSCSKEKNATSPNSQSLALNTESLELAYSDSEEPKSEALPVSTLFQTKKTFWELEGMPEIEAVELLFNQMSSDEKVSQLFMLSYSNDVPDSDVMDWIKQRNAGGVKLYGRNANSTSIVVNAVTQIQNVALSSENQIPPLIATDQEGGWIRHIRGDTSTTPGNMAIGASSWTKDSYDSAFYIGQEIKALGITMNFAPTVDLATKPYSTVVGPRAFSDNPMETAILSVAWAKGQIASGVIPTAKHFPGHGDTNLDSHGILPVIDIDEKTLWDRELIPYKMLIREGIPAIMTGHLAFPQITGSKDEASSLSFHIVQEILRDKMGYQGLVITDDLMMSGAYSSSGLEYSCEKAIRAGNDMLCFSSQIATNGNIWKHLTSLYKNDVTFKARVDESVKRILLTKIRYILPGGKDGVMPEQEPKRKMHTQESVQFFTEQAARSATILGKNEIPIDTSKKILVAGPYVDFTNEAKAQLGNVNSFRFSYLGSGRALSSELSSFKALIKNYDTIVVCVPDRAGADFAQEVVNAGKKLYIVSILGPAYGLEFLDTATVVCVYSYAKESFKAAFAVLNKDIEAIGKLPILHKGE